MSQASEIYQEIQNLRQKLKDGWNGYISLSVVPGVGLKSYTLELKQERDQQLGELQKKIIEMFSADIELLRILPKDSQKGAR